MSGTDALNTIFEGLMNRVCQRFSADFQPIHVMKHLLGIFMASMLYNAQATVNYMEAHSMTA